MVALSLAYSPVCLKGIQLDPKNPFRFHFFVDRGDSSLSQQELKQESAKLIKYFLASLTIPEKDLWVNLSPYEKDRIVPQEFGQTEMGRDLLAQDYLLKQITASLIYPESQLGKAFWAKVYAQAQAKYGTTNIPINTFNKVWIVPEKAVVYENKGVAFVLENHLKVMLEEDYLSLQKHTGIASAPTQAKETNQIGSQIVREIVIPALTKEVNEGKNFAQLRQVFYSLILATWYKKKIKDSILNKVYSNQNKIGGVNVSAGDKDKIYQEYLRAFKKGVYNYIKEEPDPMTNEVIPRKYFSGGVVGLIDPALIVVDRQTADPALIAELSQKPPSLMDVDGDTAMITPKQPADEVMNAVIDLNKSNIFWEYSKEIPEALVDKREMFFNRGRDKYEFVENLYSTSGFVFKIRHIQTQKEFALKIFNPASKKGRDISDTDMFEFFDRYQQDKSIQDLFARPVAASLGDFIAMTTNNHILMTEFIQGSKFLDIKDKGEKLRVLLRLIKELADVHRKGIFNGDLNSTNVIVQSGQPKLIDWDSVRVLNKVDDIRKLKLGIKYKDIYSTGLLLCDIFAPDVNNTSNDFLQKHTFDKDVDINDRSNTPVGGLEKAPPEIRRIIRKAILADSHVNYESLDELLKDLEKALLELPSDWKIELGLTDRVNVDEAMNSKNQLKPVTEKERVELVRQIVHKARVALMQYGSVAKVQLVGLSSLSIKNKLKPAFMFVLGQSLSGGPGFKDTFLSHKDLLKDTVFARKDDLCSDWTHAQLLFDAGRGALPRVFITPPYVNNPKQEITDAVAKFKGLNKNELPIDRSNKSLDYEIGVRDELIYTARIIYKALLSEYGKGADKVLVITEWTYFPGVASKFLKDLAGQRASFDEAMITSLPASLILRNLKGGAPIELQSVKTIGPSDQETYDIRPIDEAHKYLINGHENSQVLFILRNAYDPTKEAFYEIASIGVEPQDNGIGNTLANWIANIAKRDNKPLTTSETYNPAWVKVLMGLTESAKVFIETPKKYAVLNYDDPKNWADMGANPFFFLAVNFGPVAIMNEKNQKIQLSINSDGKVVTSTQTGVPVDSKISIDGSNYVYSGASRIGRITRYGKRILIKGSPNPMINVNDGRNQSFVNVLSRKDLAVELDEYIKSNNLYDPTTPITEQAIKDIHRISSNYRTKYNKGVPVGEYRTQSAWTDTIFYPSFDKIPSLMNEFIMWLSREELITNNPENLAAEAMRRFISIHPFSDVNGSVGAILANIILLRKNRPLFNVDWLTGKDVLLGDIRQVELMIIKAQTDQAMRAKNLPGGIDLNPAQMSMQVKKQGEDFKFNFNGTEIDAAQVIGATFTIRTMTPVTNLPQILGLNQELTDKSDQNQEALLTA